MQPSRDPCHGQAGHVDEHSSPFIARDIASRSRKTSDLLPGQIRISRSVRESRSKPSTPLSARRRQTFVIAICAVIASVSVPVRRERRL